MLLFLLILALEFIFFVILHYSNRKSALLTGPESSGKTTFLRYISKKKIPDDAFGASHKYKVEDAFFYEVTDLRGSETWLNEFDKELENHDYVLFFFDVSEYLKDEHYREETVNARIDFINNHSKTSQKILLIGTHIDKAPSNYQSEVEKCFACKRYRDMLKNAIYIDTTKKECVEKVHKAL